MGRFVHGWNRDRFDPRDVLLHVGAAEPVPLVPFVDLSSSPHMPPVYDQGQLGSCTANAVAAVIDFERHLQGLPFLTPSRLAIYYGERQIEGTVGIDSGAQIRDGIKVSVQGVGPESLWPYDIDKFADAPSDQYTTESVKHKDLSYSRVSQADYYIGHCLQILSRPIAFGMSVFIELELPGVAESGVLPMPSSDENPIGGHAVVIVGRDEKNDQYIIRNSWGPGWGQSGYFRMPRPYVLNPQLASDFWCVLQES
jgi:C1A family cysteine protease